MADGWVHLVDDDPGVRDALAFLLRSRGYAIRTFASAREFLDAYRDDWQGWLFSDVQMPGSRNGFALARETAGRWPHISIVIASGNLKPGPDDMPKGAHFIGKPFSAETVHAHVKEVLPDGQKPDPLKN